MSGDAVVTVVTGTPRSGTRPADAANPRGYALLPALHAARRDRVIDLRRPWPGCCARSASCGRARATRPSTTSRCPRCSRRSARRPSAGHAAWLRLDYPEVVADPAAPARRLAAFVGGSLDLAAMTAVVEPALYRQRSP